MNIPDIEIQHAFSAEEGEISIHPFIELSPIWDFWRLPTDLGYDDESNLTVFSRDDLAIVNNAVPNQTAASVLRHLLKLDCVAQAGIEYGRWIIYLNPDLFINLDDCRIEKQQTEIMAHCLDAIGLALQYAPEIDSANLS